MNIKELEMLTGVTKQNIRFYERKGLLAPDRNPQNDYREYTDDDVMRLQTIKMFRKLEVSIEDIKMILNQEIDLREMIEKQLKLLTEQQSHLKASIEICRQLAGKDLSSINVPEVLEKMTEIEKKGGGFMDILEDYKKVVECEGIKKFSFEPNTMVMSPREFTDALLKYAEENNLEITITKESMYPEFRMNGIDYRAERIFLWFIPRIWCYMLDSEDGEAIGIPEKRRERLKLIHRMVGPVILFILAILFWAGTHFSMTGLLIILIGGAVGAAMMAFYYRKERC